jgi:hypothetical protein
MCQHCDETDIWLSEEDFKALIINSIEEELQICCKQILLKKYLTKDKRYEEEPNRNSRT